MKAYGLYGERTRGQLTGRRRPSSPGGRRAGFTLVELLIAVFILAMGLVFVFSLFPVGIYSTRENIDDTRAAILARSAVARICADRVFDRFDTSQLRTLNNTTPDTFGALWTGNHDYGDGYTADDVRDTEYAQYCWLATYARIDPDAADPTDTSPAEALRVCVAIIRVGLSAGFVSTLIDVGHPDFGAYDAAVTLTADSMDATLVQAPADLTGMINGNWLCDLRAGRWYRIRDVDPDKNGSLDTIQLDRPAGYTSNGVADTFKNVRFFPSVVTVLESTISR